MPGGEMVICDKHLSKCSEKLEKLLMIIEGVFNGLIEPFTFVIYKKGLQIH